MQKRYACQHGLRLMSAPSAESDQLLPQEGEAARSLSIPEIFGATGEDADQLRIVSLYEVLPAASVLCTALHFMVLQLYWLSVTPAGPVTL